MKTATVARYAVFGTMRHHLRVTYKGKTIRWRDGPADVWSDWLDLGQSADLDNARAVARRFGFTHIRYVGDWDKRGKRPRGGKL